jgi:hypothetical protein
MTSIERLRPKEEVKEEVIHNLVDNTYVIPSHGVDHQMSPPLCPSALSPCESSLKRRPDETTEPLTDPKKCWRRDSTDSSEETVIASNSDINSDIEDRYDYRNGLSYGEPESVHMDSLSSSTLVYDINEKTIDVQIR